MRKAVNALVVVLILIVGAGFLAAGVVKAREAAARVECQVNLRMIGGGLDSFRDQQGTWPQGTLALDNSRDEQGTFSPGTLAYGSLPPERRLSWLVDFVRYVDQMPPLVIDRDKAWDADENREPRFRSCDVIEGRTVWRESPVGELKFLLCPANPDRAARGPLGLTHYVGVAGLGRDAAARPVGSLGAGLFGYDRRTLLEDVKDGTGTTMAVIETAWANGPWTAGGEPTVRGLDPSRQPYLGGGRPFGGTHPGGVNVLFADGSVRFLRRSINPRTFEALATIAGGEEVKPFDAE